MLIEDYNTETQQYQIRHVQEKDSKYTNRTRCISYGPFTPNFFLNLKYCVDDSHKLSCIVPYECCRLGSRMGCVPIFVILVQTHTTQFMRIVHAIV